MAAFHARQALRNKHAVPVDSNIVKNTSHRHSLKRLSRHRRRKIMTEYISPADTAKIIRCILKAKFPGIKFSVRSESYSMGSSVRVCWTDGPTTKQVDQVVGVLAGSTFDGSIDLKVNITHWLSPDGSIQIANSQGTTGSRGYIDQIHNPKPHPDAREVSFADHVSTVRSYSREFLEAVIKATSSKFGGEVPKIQDDYIGMSCQDYNQERLYWVILSSSVIQDGEVVCYDHQYGPIINKKNKIFDLKSLEAEFGRAAVQEDDSGNRIKFVFLGSVLALVPSGKYYQPWASGNVTEDEAEKDEAWYEQAEAELASIGASLESGQGDACDLFAVKVIESCL